MELDFIQDMFDAIADRYDFLNRLLSLRQDVYWRRTMISAITLLEKDSVLDVACGTGDVINELLRQKKYLKQMIGADFSTRMLELAKYKLCRDHKISSVELVAANGLRLPFASNTFNAVTIAFGIRNIMDRKSALAEFYRLLKPGGTLAVLELTTPENRLFDGLYLLYFQKILPKIGALFSKNMKAYAYLPSSVIHFPNANQFAGIMRQAGFVNIRWRFLTMGIATLFIGDKADKK